MNRNNPGLPHQRNLGRGLLHPGPLHVELVRRGRAIANLPQGGGGGGNGGAGHGRPEDIKTKKNRFAESIERKRKIREHTKENAVHLKRLHEEVAPVLLIECLSSVFNDAKLSDITFQVGSRLFHAHKLILSAWSEVFRSMSDERWSTGLGSGKPQEVTLSEPAECHDFFEDFLRFMYTEKVELTKDNVYPILTLADKYLVRDLCDVCEEYLLVMLDSTTTLWEDATKALERTGGLPRVQARSFSLLENNFPRSSQNDISKDCLIRLLYSSKLVVPNETFIFEAVMQWLKDRDDSQDSEDLVPQLLSLVRFEHIPANDLAKLWQRHPPPLQSILKEKVFNAVTSRALAAEEAYNDMQQDFTTPRMYIEPTFCVHVHNRDNHTDGALPFRLLRLYTESKDLSTFALSFPVARQGPARNIYAIDKNMWEVGGLALQQEMEDKWNVRFLIRPHFDDIGRSYSVAILSHESRLEEHLMHPITCVARGDVGKEIIINIPPTSLEYDHKPERLWVRVAIYVYGEDKCFI